MPPYDLLGVEALLYMTGVGLLVVLVIALARGSRARDTTPRDEDVHEFGGDVSESRRPVPWLIWLLFVGYFVWAAGYVLFVGKRGI